MIAQSGEWVLAVEGICRVAVGHVGLAREQEQEHYEVEVAELTPRWLILPPPPLLTVPPPPSPFFMDDLCHEPDLSQYIQPGHCNNCYQIGIHFAAFTVSNSQSCAGSFVHAVFLLAAAALMCLRHWCMHS